MPYIMLLMTRQAVKLISSKRMYIREPLSKMKEVFSLQNTRLPSIIKLSDTKETAYEELVRIYHFGSSIPFGTGGNRHHKTDTE